MSNITFPPRAWLRLAIALFFLGVWAAPAMALQELPNTSIGARGGAASYSPPDVVWSVTGGSIEPSGLYTAGTSAGSFRIIASSRGFADTSAVTVFAPAVRQPTKIVIREKREKNEPAPPTAPRLRTVEESEIHDYIRTQEGEVRIYDETRRKWTFEFGLVVAPFVLVGFGAARHPAGARVTRAVQV